MNAVPGRAPTAPELSDADIEQAVRTVGLRAREAAASLAQTTADQRTRALMAAAAAIRAAGPRLIEANDADMAAARTQDLSAAMLDRLRLDAARIEAMAAGVATVAALPDPLNRTLL